MHKSLQLMDKIDELLKGFPLLPIPESLEKSLNEWLDSLPEKNDGQQAVLNKTEFCESYQEDAGTGSSGKPAEEGR